MKYLAKFLLVGWLAVGIASSCPALIINGAANATAPTSDPGWSNVGTLGGASCVYLGNGWVLTAGHVGEGTVNLNGTAYNADPNITPVGFSSSPGSTTSADLEMFRLQTTPAGLGTLNLIDPGQNLYTVHAGYGHRLRAGQRDDQHHMVEQQLARANRDAVLSRLRLGQWRRQTLGHKLPFGDHIARR